MKCYYKPVCKICPYIDMEFTCGLFKPWKEPVEPKDHDERGVYIIANFQDFMLALAFVACLAFAGFSVILALRSIL